MTNKRKAKILKTAAFVCHSASGLLDILADMPNDIKDDLPEKIYDMSIREIAYLLSGVAAFPDDDDLDFDNLLS